MSQVSEPGELAGLRDQLAEIAGLLGTGRDPARRHMAALLQAAELMYEAGRADERRALGIPAARRKPKRRLRLLPE